MKIREAQQKDLEAIAKVEAVCFPAAEAASKQSIARRLQAFANHFWLLEDGDVLVGFVNGMVTDCADLTDEMYEDAGMHDENGDWQMIFGLDVIPEYRCQGCAEKMMNHLIDRAREEGRKGVVLTCKDRLVHYYAKFGFVNEGISGSTHGDAVWYQMRMTL